MLYSFPSPDQMTTQTDQNINKLVSMERSGASQINTITAHKWQAAFKRTVKKSVDTTSSNTNTY